MPGEVAREETAEPGASGEQTAVTFSNCDMELWEPCDDPAAKPLPTELQCLDVFAGCGGTTHGGRGVLWRALCLSQDNLRGGD